MSPVQAFFDSTRSIVTGATSSSRSTRKLGYCEYMTLLVRTRGDAAGPRYLWAFGAPGQADQLAQRSASAIIASAAIFSCARVWRIDASNARCRFVGTSTMRAHAGIDDTSYDSVTRVPPSTGSKR